MLNYLQTNSLWWLVEEGMDQSFVPDLSDSVMATHMNGGMLIKKIMKKKIFPGLVYLYRLLQITAVLDFCLVLHL